MITGGSGPTLRRVQRRHRLVAWVAACAAFAVIAGCSGSDPGLSFDTSADGASNDTDPTFEADVAEGDPDGDEADDGSDASTSTAVDGADPDRLVQVLADDPLGAVDPRIRGTNIPVWSFPEVLADEALHDLIDELGVTLLRFPGGSWSNDYNWSGCALADSTCDAPWASDAVDLVGLMSATGLPGMWTAAFSSPVEETAAAVAFFNGSVDDDRPIGVDRDGRDWGTVGDWAGVRADQGYPEPVPIEYWEVGNEVYGAVADAGPNCASWGWEPVWTCDPAEYVAGDAEHAGYLDFRRAILEIDPDVQVGAIGIGARGEWSDWDDTVIEAAGDELDFYIVHHYGSNGDTGPADVIDVPRSAWPSIVRDVEETRADHGLPSTPIAVTEHNMVAFIDGDDEQLMTSAANAFYLAETLGQFAANGVAIANQWHLVNGPQENGSNYALVDPDGMRRLPAYYALAMWARAGDELVPVRLGDDVDDLSVYGVTDDGLPRLIVLNPSDEAVAADLVVPDSYGGSAVTIDVVQAESLTSPSVTFNGVDDPTAALDATAPDSVELVDGFVAHEFPPFSISLVRWTAD